MRRFAWLAALVLASVPLATPAAAQALACRKGQSFERWLDGFKQQARAQGVSQATLDAAAPFLTFDKAIIAKDRGQGVFSQSFLEFATRMVQSRMSSGPAHLRKHAALLARVEKEFGVPGPVIVAFWALETDFGVNNGSLPVLRSLATLAYDCRRSEMFTEELLYALRIVQRGDLSPGEMRGAWAGEIGQTQFSPSGYFKYAVDFDGDGRRDLIHSAADVAASSANLLAKGGGWRRGEPWLQEVRVPARLPWEEADLAIKHPRSQWARWGVALADGRPLPADTMPASLILPMGRGGPAFLAYPNFGAFLEWNQSLVYATTAAYYATRLAGAPQVQRGPFPAATLPAPQILELQRLLARDGYEVGKLDGKLGLATRAAVKKAQLKYGLPADSYPTAELIARMRSGR
ncbi:MAG: lytic murein transglycosylase [Burkholderiales bacterium]|nr:lytic murein transglycosylase [Burkholderiales bacterium]